jgi:hypothetical protein
MLFFRAKVANVPQPYELSMTGTGQANAALSRFGLTF